MARGALEVDLGMKEKDRLRTASFAFFDQVHAGQSRSENELFSSNWPKRYTESDAQR